MKHTAIVLLLLGATAGVGYAQTNDSISLDSLYIPESMKVLEELEITASGRSTASKAAGTESQARSGGSGN